MAQIRVKGLTFCYDGGIDNIFEDVSFSIDTDWRLGFIGRKRKGKDHVFKSAAGKIPIPGHHWTRPPGSAIFHIWSQNARWGWRPGNL